MRELAILLAAASYGGAQTLIDVSQNGCPASAVVSVLIALPSTAKLPAKTPVICAQLDPSGFSIDTTTNPPTLRAISVKGSIQAFNSDGSLLGIATGIQFLPGIGVTSPVQISSGGILAVQPDIVTAAVPLKTNLQGPTAPQNCFSSSANGSAYTAACSTTLSAFQQYQVLNWFPDVTNAGNETLVIDTLPGGTAPVPKILTQDGKSLPFGILVPHALYQIWNDGANWRVASILSTQVTAH